MDRIDRITCVQLLRQMISELQNRELPYLEGCAYHHRAVGHKQIAMYFVTATALLEIEIKRLQDELDHHLDELARGE